MNQQKGFTITELMFAMTFVAILLLILIGSIVQFTRIYNKGITLKRVNQSGRSIGEELQRAVRPTDGQYNFANNRLCFGNSVSFVWPMPSDAPVNWNVYDGAGHVPVEGLIKVNENVCTNWAVGAIPRDKSVQLLDDGLIVREFEPSRNGGLVSFRYTISTPSEELVDATSRCSGSDDFCALNRFNVTVYARGY
ncbi:prepilin-type N-terminal cleavage/methylation domain-containing protein [Candidatus Saccharibacteria bacterium]|nr:prepilin-type N-terminal cleavage/methylation domain-containing protein [Candidatus Saccharibacteria bacterium]